MQIPLAFDKQHPALYIAGTVVVLLPLYYLSWQYHSVHMPPSRPPSTDFVNDWRDVHLVEPFNPSAISAYCDTSTWRPNLVFNLANANGGIGNVRGNILDFIFFAIEAGASIMLPGMASRSQTDISNVWASRAPFDLFFDEEWFLSAMSQACPQMTIYKPKEGDQLSEALPGNYLPHTRRMDEHPENTKQAYLAHLESWLSSQPAYSPDNLTLVNLERTLWDIDTRSLPSSFRRNFPQILRTSPPIRRLAALTVRNLAFLNSSSRLHIAAQEPPRLPQIPHSLVGILSKPLSTSSDEKILGPRVDNFKKPQDKKALHHAYPVLHPALMCICSARFIII